MKKNRLSDVVKSNYIELSKDSQGILRGGFGSIILPERDGTNEVNNCMCPPPNNCMCNGNNNCDCRITKATAKSDNSNIINVPDIF